MPGDVKVERVWQPIETAPKGTLGPYQHGPWLLLMKVQADGTPHYTVG
jgi:hypothetical protein